MKALPIAALAASALAATPAASAPANDAPNKLRAGIAAACVSGRIAPGSLAAALIKAYPPVLTVGLLDPKAVDPPARQIAKAAMAEVSNDELRALTVSWTGGNNAVRYGDGGVRVVRHDGRTVSDAERAAVLEAMLSSDGSVYAFECIPPPPVEDEAETSGDSGKKEGLPFRIALARLPEDVSKKPPAELRKSDDKSYAEFGFTADDVKDVETYTIDATLGAVFGERGGRTLRATPLLFAQVQRKGTDVPTSGGYVNNLNFGFSASKGRLLVGDGYPIFFDLAAKYLTDDDFDSRAYQASMKVQPMLPLPGNDQAWFLYENDTSGAIAWWSAVATADWMQVDDPGEKANLKTSPEFFRLGYDLAGHLRWYPIASRLKFSVQFDANYSVRDGQTEDGGDAQLVNLALRILPDPSYSFGLAYERGENLDSLERIDVWKLVLGARF